MSRRRETPTTIAAAPDLEIYAVPKFAIEGLIEVLAFEASPLAVGVTIVEPVISTPDSPARCTWLPLDDYADTVGQIAHTFATTDTASPPIHTTTSPRCVMTAELRETASVTDQRFSRGRDRHPRSRHRS